MNLTRRRLLLAAAGCVAAGPSSAQTFDHSHGTWTALLRRHVVVLRDGQASAVRYAGFAADRAVLHAYLETLSRVAEAAFGGFGKAEQQAYLINAYNAFTVELILTRYPDLKSIRDLGSMISSPWKRKFIPLLGARLSLDDIEHGMLRQRGRFDEPRVHFAVNCASIGCPALREEAFVARHLDAQLEEQTVRFLSDRTRNRFDIRRNRLEVSKIFDWYGEDFQLGHHGIASLSAFFARHAERLADDPAGRERIRMQKVAVAFLDYDWALNDFPGAA